MPQRFLVDTDVMVDFLRGDPKAIAFLRAHSTRMILSTIVAAELYAGVKGEDELSKLDQLLSLFKMVPVSADVARTGGLYKRDFHPSHGVGLADAILAATAEAEGAALKTLNVKHYPMLQGLKPAYRKT